MQIDGSYELFKNIQSQNTALSVGFCVHQTFKQKTYTRIQIKHFHNIFKQKYIFPDFL